MTITTEISSVLYDGNASTLTFPYPFKVLDELHLFVSIDGVDVPQADPTYPWTPTDIGASPGGDIVFSGTPPPTGVDNVLIYRDVPSTQEVDYTPFDSFPSETHEGALDKLTMLIQEAESTVNLSIRFPLGDVANNVLPAVADRSSKVAAFDANGNVIAVANTAGDISAHISDTTNPHLVTQTQVGLDQVDNTSDADKPVSLATLQALALKTDFATSISHFLDTANPHSVTQDQVGLDQVDNTSDVNKPVSTAQQAALDLRYAITAADAKFLHFPDGADPLIGSVVARASKFLAFDAAGEMIYSAGSSAIGDAATTSLTDADGYYSSANVEDALAEVAVNSGVLLETQNAASSALITFDTNVTSKYRYYEVRYTEAVPSTTANLLLEIRSTDLIWSAATTLLSGITSLAVIGGGSGTLKIFSPSTIAITNLRSEGIFSGVINDIGMTGGSTVLAVDGVRFSFSAGNITSGEFKLYGFI